uniref:Uncharacterized protein n=1 Tax=Avena sativa TaxID=4498 RepID=A0ACD5TFU5_AVESA
MAPTASPSSAPPDAESALAWLNTNAVRVLALLICALIAAIALHVILQFVLRVAARSWYAYGSGAALQEPAPPAEHRHRCGDVGTKPRVLALAQALPCLAYSAGLELAGSSRAECAICLAEFARGEQLRVLPRCSHGFHAHCIDRWLAARPTCPTCRQQPFPEPREDERVVAADRARPVAVVAVVRVIVDGGGPQHVEI